MRSIRLVVVVWLAVLVALTNGMLSEAVAFDIALTPSDDNRISQQNPTRSNGATDFLTLGGDHLFDFSRILLRYDLTGLPPAISDGVLGLRVDDLNGTQVYDGRTAELFEIKTSNADWIEGRGDKNVPPQSDAVAMEGESSWESRDVPNAWDGGPGLGLNSSGTGEALPGDGYEGVGGSLIPLDTYTHVGGAGSIQQDDIWEFTVPMSLINDWINTPSDNAGMLLRDSNEDSLLFDGVVFFASKENGLGAAFLTYACSALSADFDCDDDVDGDDLTVWESSFGVDPFADADGDGFSSGTDFLIWQRDLGMVASVASATTVPEPSAMALLSIFVLLLSKRIAPLIRR